MAGGFTTVGQVLQLIGQAPVEHGTKSAVEKKRQAKSTFPMFSPDSGPLQSILQKMVQNPGQILSNPIGGLTQALGGQLSGITGQLTSMISGGGVPGLSTLQTAIGSIASGTGLQGALSSLSGASAALSGITGSSGAFDLTAVRGLSNLIDTVGQGVLPSNVTLEAALGPAFSGSMVNNIAEVLMPMAEQVVAGGDPSAMLAQVQQFTSQVQGILNASTGAFAGAFAASSGVGNLSVLMSSVLDNPGGTFGNFLSMIQQPDAAADISDWAASIQARFDAVKAGEPGGTTSV